MMCTLAAPEKDATDISETQYGKEPENRNWTGLENMLLQEYNRMPNLDRKLNP